MALWMLGIGPSSSGRAASTLNLLSTTQSLQPCKDDSYMHVFVTMCQREKCLCKWYVQTSCEVRLASAPSPANSGNAYFPTGYFNDFPCHPLSLFDFVMTRKWSFTGHFYSFLDCHIYCLPIFLASGLSFSVDEIWGTSLRFLIQTMFLNQSSHLDGSDFVL